MGTNLVIVESPAKAKTIKKYLGKNFIVEASMGHVRDLPKSQLGVDIENNYEPKYITIRGKGDLLAKLRKEAKKCDKIYLATDPDREGEAISWHLSKVLKMEEKEKCRIEFNEITKTAIKSAIKIPRQINMDLVDSQQARRMLDRLVGYEISPILWRKVKWGLSAGRVQSSTLKMICDREKEISSFIPKEYWSIDGIFFSGSDKKKKISLKLHSYKGKKLELSTGEEVERILKELKGNDYIIDKIKESEKVKNPLPPFTTSTLQQDAYRKLNFPTKRTMSVAQGLYEGIDIPKQGLTALITYMRTDSVRISEEAQNAAINFIKDSYGEEFAPKVKRQYKGKKNIQDAHEAIRPTYVEITPESLKGVIKDEQYKLYNLIWTRFMASQMSSCILDTVSLSVKNKDYLFKASGSKIKFEGFMRVYSYSTEEDAEKMLPLLKEKDILTVEEVKGNQHFTQPPARFSEASLVKTLEENGIGRPSTYSPTIATILGRKYVEREKKTLIPTELGVIVNDIMCEFFERVVNTEFTAEMEEKLDSVELGDKNWKTVVKEFFNPVLKDIEKAENELGKITIEDKVTDVICDKCGKNMVIKSGRFGDFLACPGYPECKNTKQIVEELNTLCPKCGGTIVARKSKKGRKFFGCKNYPECDFVSWNEPVDEKCEKCNSMMVKKTTKAKGDHLLCTNEECKHIKILENIEK